MTALKYIAIALVVAQPMMSQIMLNNQAATATQAATSQATTPQVTDAAANVGVPERAATLTITRLSGDYAQVPAPPAVQEIVLRDGTPVRIRLARTLSSEQSKTGDEIDFDVLDDIRIGSQVVIPRGSKAIGSVTEAQPKRRMGRGGQLNLALSYVRLDDGTKVTLRAERDTKGGGHVGAMSAGMVASFALGFGLPAPLFLLMHGKEAVVPAGTEMTAYVNGDIHLTPVTTIAAR